MPDNQTAKTLDELLEAFLNAANKAEAAGWKPVLHDKSNRDAVVAEYSATVIVRTNARAAIHRFHQEAIAREGDQRVTEIMQLRGLVLELSQTLAKRCLADANADDVESREWPAGQEWDELNGTSQSIMRRRGWAEAGLDAGQVIALMCDECGSYKEYDVEPLRSRSTTPLPEGETT